MVRLGLPYSCTRTCGYLISLTLDVSRSISNYAHLCTVGSTTPATTINTVTADTTDTAATTEKLI